MLRHLLYPFLPYRSIVVPFLVLSAIVVPCWVILRLYGRRAPGSRPSLRREALLLIVVAYLSGLVAATLAPNDNPRLRTEAMSGLELRPDLTTLTCSSAMLPTDAKVPTFCAYNAKGNVLLFFPLGILMPLVWPRLGFWRGMQIALALSLTIELLQYLSAAWGSHRLADINDVILNGVGAALGLGLMSVVRYEPRR